MNYTVSSSADKMFRHFTVSLGALFMLGSYQGVVAQQASVMSEGSYSLKLHGTIDPRFEKGEQPQLHMAFSIEKKDGSRVERLGTDQINARLLRKVADALEPTASLKPLLVETGSKSSGVPVLFMLDISGSMLHPEEGKDETFNKLTVVQDAMRKFVDSGKLSTLEIATFFDADMEQTVLAKSGAKEAGTKIAIDQIEASHEDRPTALYHAMLWAIQEAQRQGIHHIVFLTDGQDETYGGYENFLRLKTQATLAEGQAYRDWQRDQQEPAVVDLALKSGKVRIHTIGIGNPKADLFQDSFTDCNTLKRISDRTFGTHNCINTVELRRLSQSGDSTTDYQESLSINLKSVLEQINETVLYNYELGLSINRNDLQVGENVVKAEFQVEQEIPYLDVKFDWDGDKITDPKGEIGWRLFARPHVDVDLNSIAVPIGGVLAALSLIPVIFGRAASLVRKRQERSALMVLKSGSRYIGKECPEERSRMGSDYLFKSGDPIVVCPRCGTPHHLDCWINGGSRCYLQHCRAVVPVSDKDLDRMGFQSSV
jgi:hypothetical protein